MSDIFRMLSALRSLRLEFADDAIDEIIRLRAQNERLVDIGRRLERMLEGGGMAPELLKEVKKMFEAKP